MTARALLSSHSSVSAVSAREHLKNIITNRIIACGNFIHDDEDKVELEHKDDIISLKNEDSIILKTKTENVTKMENLYGIQENC